MAALAVMVLLLVSLVWTPVSCASLSTVMGQPRSSQNLRHLCGNSLMRALQLVCSSNFYPVIKKEFPSQYDEALLEELPMFPFLGIPHHADLLIDEELDKKGLRVRRGISDECCIRKCSLDTLKSYCAA